LGGALPDKAGAGGRKIHASLRGSLDSFIASATKEQLRGVDIIVQRF
jgi:hypothetical protein